MDTALKKMWRLHCDGQPVQHFKVFENEPIFDYEGSPSAPFPLTSKTPGSGALALSAFYSLMPAASLDIPPQTSGRDGGVGAPLQQTPHRDVSSLRALSAANAQFGGGGSGYMGAQNEPGISGRGYVRQEQLTPRADKGAASYLRRGFRQRQAPGYYASEITAGLGMDGLEGYVGSSAYDGSAGFGSVAGFDALEASAPRRALDREDYLGGASNGQVGAGSESRSVQLMEKWKSVGLSADQAAGLSANRAVLTNGKLPSGYHISGGLGLTLQMGNVDVPGLGSDGLREGSDVTRGAREGNRLPAEWRFENGAGVGNGNVQTGDWGSAFVRKSEVRGATASAPIEIEGFDEVGLGKGLSRFGVREDPGALRWERTGKASAGASKPRGYTVISLQHELPESIAKDEQARLT